MGSLLILSSMSLVILLLIWSYFQRVPLGDNPSTKASVSPPSPTAKLYIVDLGERRYEDPQLVIASHHDMLSAVLGRYIFSVTIRRPCYSLSFPLRAKSWLVGALCVVSARKRLAIRLFTATNIVSRALRPRSRHLKHTKLQVLSMHYRTENRKKHE